MFRPRKRMRSVRALRCTPFTMGSLTHGGAMGSFSGQSYLQQVAEATGAQSFYQGTITPPSLSPYLREFTKSIAESYTVSFNVPAAGGKRDTLTQIKLTSKQPGVKIHGPQNVHPGMDLH